MSRFLSFLFDKKKILSSFILLVTLSTSLFSIAYYLLLSGYENQNDYLSKIKPNKYVTGLYNSETYNESDILKNSEEFIDINYLYKTNPFFVSVNSDNDHLKFKSEHYGFTIIDNEEMINSFFNLEFLTNDFSGVCINESLIEYDGNIKNVIGEKIIVSLGEFELEIPITNVFKVNKQKGIFKEATSCPYLNSIVNLFVKNDPYYEKLNEMKEKDGSRLFDWFWIEITTKKDISFKQKESIDMIFEKYQNLDSYTKSSLIVEGSTSLDFFKNFTSSFFVFLLIFNFGVSTGFYFLFLFSKKEDLLMRRLVGITDFNNVFYLLMSSVFIFALCEISSLILTLCLEVILSTIFNLFTIRLILLPLCILTILNLIIFVISVCSSVIFYLFQIKRKTILKNNFSQ